MTEHTFAMRPFETGDEAVFRRLNEEWIRHHFALEAHDELVLADPQAAILDRGGKIFLAMQREQVLGCCALIAMAPGEFELAKMAVTPEARGMGLGRFQLEWVIAEARATGVRRLYLETNHALAPAIHLYESVGFQRLPTERVPLSPYARADVSMELWL